MIIEGIKNIVKKIILKEKSDSDSYISFLRKGGAIIGNYVTIHEPRTVFIDPTRPFLIEIGNNVEITRNVTILTHGYDWSVLKAVYGNVLGSSGKVSIGNNVFIGMNSTILKGISIGNNVIIGANSLVNKDIPDNCVVAGNPAKVITDMGSYYKKRLSNQLNEAKEMAIQYKKNCGEIPPKEIFYEFFWLFENRNENGFKIPKFESMMYLKGNYNKSVITHNKYNKEFNNYDDFLKYCFSGEESKNKTKNSSENQ